MPAITVSAHVGNALAYDRSGVSVTVLDIPELKKEGIYTAAEALTTVPGVYSLSGGGENQRGNICNVVIRGLSSGDSFMPMIDGMRLSGLLCRVRQRLQQALCPPHPARHRRLHRRQNGARAHD